MLRELSKQNVQVLQRHLNLRLQLQNQNNPNT